ncbi:GerAB/ArcD/ProY family transporter [Virgibacillus ainsalahensis]
MKNFSYADEKISDREIMVAVPSMMIGVGILLLPRTLAENTVAADGWIAILIGGMIVIVITWMVAKLAAGFPGQSFFEYASMLVTKPVASILMFLFVIQSVLLTAYEIRAIAATSHRYLFDRTPVEVVALTFLLIVVYAVSGSRAGIFRLNIMFLPIILFLSIILILFSLQYVELENLLPVFKTDIQGYLQGTREGMLSYTGVGILFFYIAYVRRPKNAPKKAVLGMTMAISLYVFLFLTCIAVFGNMATANIMHPTVELSKAVEVPGGFFERFESVFFVIWIMAIFNTTVMAFDIGILALHSIFSKVKKTTLIFALSPLIFFISMLPQDFTETTGFGNFVSYYGLGLTVTAVILLLIVRKVRGVK